MLLTQTEEELLSELDRIVDWHISENKELTHITISDKQSKAITRILNKAGKNNDLYRRIGKLELTNNHYRGIPFSKKQNLRRSRRRKDTQDIFA